MTTPLVTRRTALKALGATGAFLPWLSDEGLAEFAAIQAKKAPPRLKVLTTAQYATVEALVEAIIPADERSPGAREARVADYIDLLLSEADAPLRAAVAGRAGRPRRRGRRSASARRSSSCRRARWWRSSPTSASTSSRSRSRPRMPPSTSRATSSRSRSRRRWTRCSATSASIPPDGRPSRPSSANTKQATIHGYYTSEIGIHKDLRYKGNQILAEFVGCVTVDGKDCPHCGRKAKA